MEGLLLAERYHCTGAASCGAHESRASVASVPRARMACLAGLSGTEGCMDAALLSWSRAAGDRADVGTASGVLLVVRVCHSRRLDRARRPGPSSPATSGTLRRHAARSVASQLNAWPLAGAAPHASTHPPERNQLDLERTRAPDGGRWSIRRSLPQSGNKFTAPGRTVVS